MTFPIPREVKERNGRFKVDPFVAILVPQVASSSDLFLARFISTELANLYGVPLKIRHVERIPKGQRFILIGSTANPLVQQYRQAHAINASADVPGREGYVLDADERAVAILGSDEAGAFYGLQTLRQLLEKTDDVVSVAAQQITDSPYKPFRGVYLFVPGPRHIPYFKHLVRDVLALYKLNKVIVEMDASMQFDRHPELNAGWIDFTKDMKYTRRGRPAGPHDQFQDSGNMDFTDGTLLEKDDVADMVQYARQHYVDVIPMIATLTHSYYLLTRHRELAQIQSAEWPATYRPMLPATYKLVFDVMDEYIEVMKPRMVHIGHDEWRIPWDLCPSCKGKDPTVLYAGDVNKLHSYLKGRNIEVAMWGDHLVERVRGKGFRHGRTPTGFTYRMPGALSPQQVRELIPKDILIFNWFWNNTRRGRGEDNDIELQDFGFHQVYGNLTPEIPDYEHRSRRKSVLGGAPSNWAATTEFNFGKDMMYNILGCANLVWSSRYLQPEEVSEKVQQAVPSLRRRVSMELWPSQDDPVTPLDISAHLNAPAGAGSLGGINPASLRSGRVRVGNAVFDVVNPGGNGSRKAVMVATGAQQPGAQTEAAIPLEDDVSSVLFLHAAAQASQNVAASRETWDYAGTAGLLGFYRFIYEDGLAETAPIRYAVNILEAGWGKQHDPQNIAWDAVLADCGARPGEPVTFFAYEWVNPRFGKPIKEIRLEGISGFRNFRNRPIKENAVILLAVSVVKKRPASKERASVSPWLRPEGAS